MKAHIWRMVAATSCFLIIGSFVLRSGLVEAAVMNDYCMVPPFVAQSIPPLVMLDVGRDHKLYYQAYSDAADLNGDGKLDIDYTHTIDYYGYFDSYKCYDYSSSQFVPAATSADKFCTSGKWSGNFLNWVTMSRMDVLRKVLYGGNRIVDTTAATVLQRVYTPQDAHSWGKEITGRLCKSGTTYTHTCSINSDCDSGQTCANLDSDGKYLTPFAAATAPTTCTSVALPAAQSGKILVARYRHSSGKNCGTGNTQGMINSYEPGRLFHPTAVPNLAGTSTLVDYVTGFDNSSLAPSNTYADDYNIIAVTGFTPDVSGAWQFAVDGDDDVEVQVGGTVVVQYLGCHGPDNNQTHNGTITLTAGTTYTLVARHFEKGGGEGVRVWFKRPGAADWKYVSSDSTVTNPYASLALSAPTIEAGNECAIGTVDFITTGTPTVGVTVVSGSTQYHLFCNTTLSVAGTPIMRVLENKLNRIWDWSAKERPVCDTSLGTPTDYTVSANVCAAVSPDNRPSDKKDLAASGRETNCRAYTSTTGTTTYKPTGLLQKYSQGDGAKVCSKNLTKTCTTATTDSSDCGAGEGLCIYRAPMYFGMISGSYMKNESGGVLRKNLGTMLDEINLADGTFMTGTQGIINTFENMRIVGFRYGGNYDYNDASGGTCGWITDRPLAEGECRMWGNPIGEMFYETLRYFAGKGAATTDFVGGITNGNDSGLNLPLPSWGYTKGGTAYQPYDMFPTCSKPFALILSDINPSYDSDQIPGSSFSKNDDGITFFSEDTSTLPVLGLGTVTGGFSLLNQLTDTIGSHEPSTTSPIDGNSWFVGQSSISPWNYDNLCTSKNISYLSKVRGLCPEEPTKRGSYYTAALAYFGKTMFKTKTGKPDLTTYAVAMSSPVADLKIKAGSNTVTMVPIGKSISGCLGVQGSCIDKCTTTTVDANGIHLSGCATDAFCPSNQIVNFFVDDIRYNSDKDVIYASFRINYEDVEQGADHDMDAIVKYEICTQAAKDAGLGSCVTDLGSNLEVKLSSDYAAGCIDQVLGFIISGTSADGTYLVVKDKDVGGSGTVSTLPLVWSKQFTPNGNAAGFLKNPLWYAAKWGGFVNSNQTTNGVVVDGSTTIPVPDLTSEWAKNDSVTPDNYYLVVNPLRLEQQLDKALTEILAKTSSGTAASIVNNRGQSGSNILTAIFYPQKDFSNNQVLSWLGDLQNYWYYFDPYLSNSTIREDTITDSPNPKLILTDDYKLDIHFDSSQNKTVAARSDDDGKGNYTSVDTKEIDDLNALWRAGLQLYNRNLSTNSRTIYTQTDDATRSNFTTLNASTLQPYLGVADVAAATKTINYVLGFDTPSDATLRNRSVNFQGVTPSATTGVGVWKLGDIINSTPKIQSGNPINGYHLDYGDSSYGVFIKSGDYVNNTMVYTGANDGMLHAFRLGKNIPLTSTTGTHIAELTNPGSTPPLGSEVWAFIPKNALPYLQYLSDPNYGHLYYVDNTPLLVDASIYKPGSCSSSVYWDCPKITTTSAGSLNLGETSWRTVMVGSMGLGGASRPEDGSCAAITGTLPDTLANCVKTPLATTGFTNLGLSSYFALDVTSASTPSLLWEFSHPDLGYSTVDPVIVRINGKKGSGPNPNDPDPTKNGRWFLVFGSGPTGPIEPVSHQFYARSDKNLKIFVVDLNAKAPFVLNTNYWVFEPSTPIANAFCGSLTTNGINVDKKARNSTKYYDTEVVYIGYVKPQAGTTPKTWTDGGILRLVTNGDTDPGNWALSTLIDGVGPVTASIDKMYDDKDTTSGTVIPVSALWLYFGTGRFYYKNSTAGIDSATNTMHLYAIKEPCYSVNQVGGVWSKDLSRHINTACVADTSFSQLVKSTLTDQSSDTPNATMLPGKKNGWFIDLDASTTTYAAERLITTPDARTNGMVVFTTFKPTADICGFGGETFFWFTDFKTGGPPPLGTLTGKIVIQLSTGAIVIIDLSKLPGGGGSGGSGAVSDTLYRGGRQLDVGAGKPPTPKPAADSLKTPVKKILQIQEK